MTDKMREEFEAWITNDWSEKAAKRGPDGQYIMMHACSAWRGWQAAWKAATAPPPAHPKSGILMALERYLLRRQIPVKLG